MTKGEILAMEAGAELSSLVALKVMGWRWSPYLWWDGSTKTILTANGWEPHGDDFNHLEDGNLLFWDMPNYSKNISAAWETIQKTTKDGWMLYKLAHTLSGKSEVDGYICIFLNIDSGASREAIADTAPEAICKSALLTLVEL